MKKLILALYAIILAVSLIGAGFDRSTEKMYLNIETGLLSFLQSGNPAEMSSENIPCDVKYSLRQIRESGKLRSIYTPDSLIDTRLSATAYKSMKKGAIFAGTFSYRNASRKNLMWLHSAENNLLMPFYLADSSSGDYNLTGITWEAAVSFSVAPYLRGGLSVFYNVDEQYKSVFPKPNIKRNDLRVSPGLLIALPGAELGLTASIYSFMEKAETRKYSLEQGKTPTLMLIRGLDHPVILRAETSYERQQSILGRSLGGHILLQNRLYLDGEVEKASAGVTDGGSYPVDQGSWDMSRRHFSVKRRFSFGDHVEFIPYYCGDIRRAAIEHPTLNATIFRSENRIFEGGFSCPVTADGGSLTFSGDLGFEDVLQEDTFSGISFYVPVRYYGGSLQIGSSTENYSVDLTLGYHNYISGSKSEYAELTGWYYDTVVARTLRWLSTDKHSWDVAVSLDVPVKTRHLVLNLTYTGMQAKDFPDERKYFTFKMDYIF